MPAELFEQLGKYFAFYAPLGVIGVWRWSVWLLQTILASFYRPRKDTGKESFSFSIVTPVYNENPDVFTKALSSWKENNPQEIIAVIDSSDGTNIDIFRQFAINNHNAKLIITETPGKRPALVRGMMEVTSEIVALVDSDTIWGKDVSKNALIPFSERKVGGVGTRQAVINPKTLAERLFSIRLNLRYFHELPFLMVAGNANTCLSGRTAFYRMSAVFPLLEKLLTEKFLGKPCISGDDKRFTSLVQAAGWHTRFQQNSLVWTPGMPKMGKFFMQNLRWARNSWRTDLGVIFSAWPWKREPIYAYHLIDRVVQPFTLLLGLIFFITSISLGHYVISSIIFSWWMISRMIKLHPHLRMHPKDIAIVPFFALAQYFLAVLKIYAFFTMNHQGWITRWDSNRLKQWSWFSLLPSRMATLLLIGALSFFVARHQFTIAQQETDKVESKRISYTSDFTGFELAEKEDIFWSEREKSSVATYLTQATDTPLLIQKRFNLSPEASAKYIPNYPSNFLLRYGTKVSMPVKELSNVLQDGPVRLEGKPLVVYDALTNTIRLKGRGSVMTIPFIQRSLQYSGITKPLQETSPGEWMLRSNLYAGDGVTLIISDKSGVKSLKIKSDEEGFGFIQTYNANMLIKDTKITSWDEKNNSPDTKYQDGRAYILAKRSGRMDVLNSDIGFLGYPRFTKIKERIINGGGIYGLSWKINSGKFGSDLLTGTLANSKIHDNYFGMYSFGATALNIENNEVFNNIQYGIDPHDDSNNLNIENNFVHNNGNHGIIGSKRVTHSIIKNNVSVNNALHGIMLDRQSNYNLVENNTSSSNVNGLAIYDSQHNLIRENVFEKNRIGIRANMNSSKNIMRKNSIQDNNTGVFVYGGASDNFVANNVIKNNELGIYLKETEKNIVYEDLKWKDNGKNIAFDKTSTKNNFVREFEKPWWMMEMKK